MDKHEDKYFITSNFSLCGYLELNGLKFVKADRAQDRRGKINVEFTFLDPDGKGRDLEIEFRHSNEKRYKDSLFFYRKIINDLLGQ